MATFQYDADWGTPARAGAMGMFQIEYIELDGQDVTHMVDQGMLFHEEDDDGFIEYLSKTFGLPRSEVKIKPAGEDDYPYK